MVSWLHESHLLLFRNRPALAAQLIHDALGVEVPAYCEGIQMGGLHQFAPYVLGPAEMPEITEETQARASSELAVLSAMAHGGDENVERSTRIAMTAHKVAAGLDADRSKLYFDLILNSLSEAARQALKSMDARTYEYQSDFARHYVAQGEAAGRAAIVAQQLTVKFGPLSAEVQNKLREASIADLHTMAERLLAARTLREALGAT